MNIAGVEIGGSNPCRFVAEISNNHNGSLERALRLIDAAKSAGADFVKFQCYTPDELVALRGDGPAPEPWGSQGWTMRTLYEKARTPLEWFPQLFQHARDIGIVPFSSVFGLESLAILERCACPAYKIARLDRADTGLVALALSRHKPVLVSTEDYSPDWRSWSGELPIYCPPGYPTAAADVKLPRAVTMLSSHCLDPLLPVAAVARGCKLIEMHLQLDHAFADRMPSCAVYRGLSCDCDNLSELEADVSLTASQFKQMIQDVRRVEEMLA